MNLLVVYIPYTLILTHPRVILYSIGELFCTECETRAVFLHLIIHKDPLTAMKRIKISNGKRSIVAEYQCAATSVNQSRPEASSSNSNNRTETPIYAEIPKETTEVEGESTSENISQTETPLEIYAYGCFYAATHSVTDTVQLFVVQNFFLKGGIRLYFQFRSN